MFRLGSLYSGIGGLEVGVLAALVEASVAARIEWQVEFEPFCQRSLRHNFPEVPQLYGDVESVHRPRPVDLIVGGFACQDVSAAGLGKGLGRETRSGNTWHHFTRLIGEVRPRAVIVENVASGAQRWVPRIVSDLRSAGYRPHAVPLGAVHVGAPHRRLRVFIVAMAHGHGHGREGFGSGGVLDGERSSRGDDADGCGRATMADGGGSGLEIRREQPAREKLAPVIAVGSSDAGREGRAPESPLGEPPHGLPFDVAGHPWPAARGEAQYLWEPERAVGPEVEITERPAKLKALGNAVVPQCSLVAGRVFLALARREGWSL